MKAETPLSKIWLIRHAESEGNAGLSTSLPTTIKLTPRGYEQSRFLARHFPQPPDLMVVSPYLRTRQTAEAVLERFPERRMEEWPIQEFTYLAVDEYRNTTTAERRPSSRAYWHRRDPRYVDGGGAESFLHFVDRAKEMLRRLSKREEPFTAIFCHGNFMRAVFWLNCFAPADIDRDDMGQFRFFMRKLIIPNAAIVKIHREPDGNLLFGKPDASYLPERLRT